MSFEKWVHKLLKEAKGVCPKLFPKAYWLLVRFKALWDQKWDKGLQPHTVGEIYPQLEKKQFVSV